MGGGATEDMTHKALGNAVTSDANAATELVMENGAVAGVKVKNDAGEYTIKAKAVILASGGFGADNEMVAQYQPSLKGYNHSCTVGAKGDGHKMAVAVGAQLGNMEHVRVNFTYTTNGVRVYYMGCLPNTGAIVVNEAGKRFVNDQGGYGVGMKVVEQGGSCWAIFDQSMIDGMADVREYYEMGLYESAATIEELAAKIGVDAVGECAYVGTNGANPMTVDVVFGGIAGENAAAYVAK